MKGTISQGANDKLRKPRLLSDATLGLKKHRIRD